MLLQHGSQTGEIGAAIGASQAKTVAQANCCAGSVVDLMPYVKVSDRCAAH